ncbi:MAG: 3-phosphoserine/phosphohydroxythreonine transaminase [Deltaproteobacteria bacterium]|nr:3-phosphoserine/phosphohydroxythreonine transaminase [Deltaproteobacteria bacterium]MBW2052624.1 3-phosphoserine/phosphohydroxythreonine transaminase [Deltaproteobacteria bacterium]MBW2140731.1 3-phosphoserine/phosphohydroxythreonine transaminase [Deltaproteobacteria bacterium]MBW2324227.1 3-phosphoserine/phosphohydroxythreonine transaminase [Deltaproteobacteria bacterium]
MDNRVHNFNPGPAALPLPVLEEIQAEMLNFKGSGMSILEISHRSEAFDEVLNDAVARVKRLLKLPDNYRVLFLQGGASSQFFQVPMNLLGPDDEADYINTGTWSTKAFKEAQILGCNVREVASSEDRNFCYIPKDIQFTPGAAYVHLTSNNTIKGTQWLTFPDTGGLPLISDMSSDIMSRPMDVTPFGLIYAGAQKNLGPSGVTLVIIREDMLERVPDNLPSMLSYKSHADKNSTYNTPPCFGIYVVQMTLKWIEDTVEDGLEGMARVNERKASLIYDLMDEGDFYRPTADKDNRSLMNVTFRLPDEELEKKFVAQALENGLSGLKGHRSVGGCRASIYNAVSLEAVKSLAAFMKDFAQANG